jgi:hypothetical protein
MGRFPARCRRAVDGAVVGAFDRKDSWAPVDLRVRAAIGPTRSGGVSGCAIASFLAGGSARLQRQKY